jgi:hypothetical protein
MASNILRIPQSGGVFFDNAVKILSDITNKIQKDNKTKILRD